MDLPKLIADRERLGGYRLDGHVHYAGVDFALLQFPTDEARTEFMAIYGGAKHDPSDKASQPWISYFEAWSCELPSSN